jgi:nucleoside-diphosphate-sugar epimerase
MKNLVIGNTSQLSYYFPDSYEKISSRNIEFSNNKYDRVYVCFAEQRTYIKDNKDIFFDANINYTLKILDHYSKNSNNVIIYGTSELWNNCNGPIDINTPFNYKTSNYIESKKIMIEIIKNKYKNVIILYPFNFNSIYRKEGFLFYKIFDSIINKKNITIGDTYFYRELLHPKFVVEQSIIAQSDNIIGSGRLVFINDFIRDLYRHFNLDYNKYVKEDIDNKIMSNNNIFYLNSKQVLYNNLYNDTLEELKNKVNISNGF